MPSGPGSHPSWVALMRGSPSRGGGTAQAPSVQAGPGAPLSAPYSSAQGARTLPGALAPISPL